MAPKLLAASISLGLAVCACDRKRDESKWTNQNFSATQSYGDTIVAAIESYQRKNGAYPATLDALVPEFLNVLEDATTGWPEWGYVVSENGRTFELSFAANEVRYPAAYWSSDKGRWIRDE